MARTTIKTTTTKTTTKTTTTRTTGGGGTPLAAPCSGRGQCETTANGLHCACYAGYTGRFCELSMFFRPCVFRNWCVIMLSYRNYRCVYCADLNECTPNPCKNGGICSDGVGEFECECQPGWSGRCFLLLCWLAKNPTKRDILIRLSRLIVTQIARQAGDIIAIHIPNIFMRCPNPNGTRIFGGGGREVGLLNTPGAIN